MWRHCKPCDVYWKENTVKCWCCDTPTSIERGPGITQNKYEHVQDPVDPFHHQYPDMITRVIALTVGGGPSSSSSYGSSDTKSTTAATENTVTITMTDLCQQDLCIMLTGLGSLSARTANVANVYSNDGQIP